MTKKIIQDVVFPSRARQEGFSRREEPISPERSFHPEPSLPEEKMEAPEDFLPKLIKKQEPDKTEEKRIGRGDMDGGDGDGSRSPRVILWVLACVVIVITLGVIFSKFFSGAVVKITPFHETPVLNADFISRENATEKGVLPYQRITLPVEERSEQIEATLEQRITKKASGKIKIFNEYSAASQRLIKNTRFESTSGKIYRIDASVVVPGTTALGGKTIPGSIVVTIFGDAPGEEYNSDPSDFSIPGFKGDPRYGRFYARSETPITGGFSGNVKVPSPEDKKASTEKLKSVLRTELLEKARLEVPPGFILYDSASFVVFDEGADASASIFAPATVVVRGIFYGIMFERSVLSRFIAEKTIKEYKGDPVSVRNLSELELKPKGEVTDPVSITDFSFILSGNPLIVWDVDSEKLKESLVGVDKREGFQKVVSGSSSIKKAEATIKPFWKKNFPEDPGTITIKEVLE